MIHCPDIMELEHYLAAELEDDSSHLLQEHLSSCRECRGRISEIEENLRAVAPVRSALAESDVTPPHSIGGFGIVRELGRGGMGAVYEAEQEHPKRAVALKVIRGGKYVDEHRIKLFEREVQTLARLKHSHIAAIYEAGRTDEGQHFFAMELARGVPLMEFARTRQLPMRNRLELFGRICQGINYAHQRGVIHRDLKPSNILIEAEGNPKILDFGLAKMTDSDLAVTSVETELGKIQGTLPYMSPEQARGNPDEIDLRSDVYSLGVMLYELMTEQLPYKVTDHGGLPEAVRVICEEAPRKPSTFSKTLRGDVETIALKALEKEPSRRYQSASAFADDVERYLTNQPIRARPPSAMYQLKKLVARHKVPFALIAALFVLTAGSSVWMTVLYGKSEREAETAQVTLAFLEDMIQGRDPVVGESVFPKSVKDPTRLIVSSRLEEATTEIDNGALADQPEVEAAIRTTIGFTYHYLQEYDKAETHLKIALDIRKRRFGEEHPLVAESLANYGWVLHSSRGHSKGDFATAILSLEQALAMQRKLLGEEHKDVAKTLHNLGHVIHNQGDSAGATPMILEALAMQRKLLGEDHPDTLRTMHSLTWVYAFQGLYDEAEPLYLQLLETRKRLLGEEHADTLTAMKHQLGELYQAQGRYDEAASLYLQVLETGKRVVGEEHRSALWFMFELASQYHELGRYDQAERL